MSNWVIYGAENYLKPIADKLKERLLVRDILHVDETTVQVLKEDGKKPETKSYMWVYRSGNDGRKPIVIYDYKPSRDGEIPEEFLKDFKGYLHTDGYAGYNKVKGVTRCGCWAHLRRKFVEADTASKGEDGYANILRNDSTTNAWESLSLDNCWQLPSVSDASTATSASGASPIPSLCGVPSCS